MSEAREILVAAKTVVIGRLAKSGGPGDPSPALSTRSSSRAGRGPITTRRMNCTREKLRFVPSDVRPSRPPSSIATGRPTNSPGSSRWPPTRREGSVVPIPLTEDGARDPTGCWVAEEHSRQAHGIVESAGLRYVDDAYIVDVVREISEPK